MGRLPAVEKAAPGRSSHPARWPGSARSAPCPAVLGDGNVDVAEPWVLAWRPCRRRLTPRLAGVPPGSYPARGPAAQARVVRHPPMPMPSQVKILSMMHLARTGPRTDAGPVFGRLRADVAAGPTPLSAVTRPFPPASGSKSNIGAELATRAEAAEKPMKQLRSYSHHISFRSATICKLSNDYREGSGRRPSRARAGAGSSSRLAAAAGVHLAPSLQRGASRSDRRAPAADQGCVWHCQE